ncbi:MAG TPA: hypothetical protein VLB86_06050 [Gaiellaceae bacterium]|nr:hypothetical protein [Gaiellaceae bacterium]
MSSADDVWLPLVDEPIGSIVDQLVADDAELAAIVERPRRLLAFKTFAYIRAGMVLGQLLVEHDVPPYDGTDTWVDLLLREPAHRRLLAREVRAVADEIAADPRYDDDERLGPDDDARERFRAFARERLG